MNMIKNISFFILMVFSFPLLASTNLNNIAGKVYEKLKEDNLTTLRQECLSFDYDNEDGESIFFSARENHGGDSCGGDENVSEKLFDMKYDKKTGYIYIEDELNPDSYQKLK